MPVSSHGTLLKVSDGLAVFATVAEVMDISGLGHTFGTGTFVSANSSEYPAVLPATADVATVTFDINYTGNAVQDALRDAAGSKALKVFRVEFPTDPADVAEFSGYVTGFEYSAPVNGVLRASVTITLASPFAYL